MCSLDIYNKDNSIFVKKDNGTEVNYYIFNEFEVHINKVPPHSIQEWHKHMIIEETLVVTKGEINLMWRDEKGEFNEKIIKDMVVRVKNSIHTIENRTGDWAEFTVFRMVPTGNNNKEIIKNDKIMISS